MDDMAMKRNWGTLKPRVPCFLFLLLVILKVPTKQFWCQWFLSLSHNSIWSRDQWWYSLFVFHDLRWPVDEGSPVSVFLCSFWSRKCNCLPSHEVVPNWFVAQSSRWKMLSCFLSSTWNLRNTVEVRTKRIEIYVYLQCISTIIW